ncbi:MAG: glycosyltransferase [Gammaproteobacteria bacterium]
MKILQVMLAKGFGGAERSFVDISDELVARGHEVTAVCEARGEARKLVKKARVIPVKVRGHWDPFARLAMTRILKKEAPDVVHAHLARAAKIAGRSAHALHIPSVVKTHNYVDLKYYRFVSHLVPTTIDQENYLRSNGVEAERLTRIPNFTSLPPATAARNIERGQPVRLVAVGRFVRKKGFDLLINAIARLPKRIKVSLKLVGDGEQRAALERLAHELSVEDCIEFTGWSSNIQPHLDAADIFVLPSRDEPFGIVCLEAMARGVPIVATNTQGPREILNTNNACVIEKDNIDALVEGIVDAVSDPEKTRRRAQSALDQCQEFYSKEVVVSQYEAVYAALTA